MGDQPDGTMTVTTDNKTTCPGYPKGTITIRYNMFPGSRNGKSFPGTNRTGYLPNNAEGQEVLRLLK